MGLQEAIQNIWSSDYVQKNPNKAYKVSYANEYAAVAAYLNGGAEPNWSGYSKLGKGLCEVEKERRGVVVPPTEPPPTEPPPTEPPPNPVFGAALRQRFPKITPTTTMDDTGKPDRTSVVYLDGTSKQNMLLKNITRRGGTGDGFKFSGGANHIEVRMCNAYDPGPNDTKPQLLNFQHGPSQVQVYGGEYVKVGHDKYSHLAYFGADAVDILLAGVMGRDFAGYGLHGYPGPGSAVAANCTVVGSPTRNGAVVYPGFDLYVVNSILADNAAAGINDQGGTWKFENCCIWPKPSNSSDGRFVNCIFEDPQFDASYRPQNPKLADGGKADWMAPHDYKGNPYSRKSIGAVAL